MCELKFLQLVLQLIFNNLTVESIALNIIYLFLIKTFKLMIYNCHFLFFHLNTVPILVPSRNQNCNHRFDLTIPILIWANLCRGTN